MIAVAILLLSSTAWAIESHKFKRWDEVGFCKRHRYLADHLNGVVNEGLRFDIGYEIDPRTFEASVEGVKFLVKSVHEAEWKLQAQLTVYADEIARLIIKEVEPLFQRYQMPDEDLLAKDKVPVGFTSVKYFETASEFSFKRLKLVVQHRPLRVDVFFDGSHVAKLNHRNLFSFERYRPKPADQDVANESDLINIVDASEILYQKDERREKPDDLWQERFREFTDNKRKGPSSVAMDVSFIGASQLYGIPEHSDTLQLADTKGGEPYRLFNLDVFEYEIDSRQALYGSIPFILAKQGSRGCGFFWNNPSNTYVDIETSDSDKHVHWMSETGVVDVFILPSDSILNIVSKFGMLTGPPALPLLASIGFHQCRWNYNDQDDTLGVVANFDRYNIPLDFIWLDIEHTVGRRYFTWDLSKFPDPAEMQNTIALAHRKVVTIIDPHIKRDSGYEVFSEASGKGKLKQWLCAILPLCAGPSDSI